MHAPRPQRVQKVQIRAVLQPENMPAGGILLIRKGPRSAPNAPGGAWPGARKRYQGPTQCSVENVLHEGSYNEGFSAGWKP